MPFLARRNNSLDDVVVPEEVPDGETVYCLSCDGEMRPRGGGSQRARHFMHVDNLGEQTNGGCDGLGESAGESERHRKLKSLAVSGLRSRFKDFDIDYCGLEYEIDVSAGPSLVNERRADAVVRFSDPITNRNRFFGEGVVVEVQYRNESKDVAAVTADYLQAGYSVYWAHEVDFTESMFRTDRFERAFNQRWPPAFSPYFIDADEALRTVKRVEFDPHEMNQSNWSFIDPRPDCDHGFHTAGAGVPFCLDCGTETTRHETGRQMFLPLGADPSR